MLVQYPDERLLEPSISAIDNLTIDERKDLAADMRKICWEVDGFGISAIQVGMNYEMFGFVSPGQKDLIWMCDPIIDWMSEVTVTFTEGCLSIPGYFWEVKRPDYIKVSYRDLDGQYHQNKFSGIDSRVIQHEIDHLNGLLIIDFLEPEDQIIFDQHYQKLSHIDEYLPPEITII